MPLSIQTPCGIQTPLAEDSVQWQQSYEMPYDIHRPMPNYAHLGQTGVPMDLSTCAVQKPLGTPNPALVTQRLGCGQPRAVLNLTEALQQQPQQQLQQQPQAPLSGLLESAPQYEAPSMKEDSAVGNPPAGPAPGSPELPSMGSVGHAAGKCKPCAFFHTKGCANDLACQFCHLCGPEAKKERRQEKLQQRREAFRAKKERQAAQHCHCI